MRIDAHQHFWRYNAVDHAWINDEMKVIQRDFLPADLKPLLEAHQLDGCIAVQAEQNLRENDFLLSLAEEHPFIKGVIGWVDFRAADVAMQIAAYAKNPLLKGFRHIVQSEPDGFLLDEDFNRGISLLKDFSLVYEILIYEHQLAEAVQFVQRHPDQLFVLDHIAKPKLHQAQPSPDWLWYLEELAQSPRVFCKISGLVTEAVWHQWTPELFRPYLQQVWRCFGPERILFGTDWPVCLLSASYGEVIDLVKDWIESVDPRHADWIWGLNARKLYRL